MRVRFETSSIRFSFYKLWGAADFVIVVGYSLIPTCKLRAIWCKLMLKHVFTRAKKTVESWKVIKSYKLLLFATHKKSDVMCIGILMFADGFAVEFWLITLEMFRLKSTTTRPPESFLLKMFQFGKSVNQTDVWNIEAINYCKRISAETAKAFLSLIESSIKKTLTSFRSGRARGGRRGKTRRAS